MLDELTAEIAVEKATTLARLGSRLDAVVLRLRALRDAADGEERREADRDARVELRELRWEMTVVKEAMGLRGVRAEVDKFWPVPPPLD